MDENRPKTIAARAAGAAILGVKNAGGTLFFLLKIVVPVTFVVALLQWSGFLVVIARFLAPLMGLLGLSGEAALVFLSSIFLNIYSAIAVAGGLGLDLRQATILAIMCLTAHNMIVETAVMRKSGSSAAKMVVLRMGAALVAGAIFNLFLPESLAARPFLATGTAQSAAILDALALWAIATGKMALKMTAIVFAIMIAQRLLEEFKVLDFLSRLFSPLMRIFGLSESASFLWIVINVVGYAYGAGIVIEQIQSGRMKKQDGDLFNHHASMCHSLLEDSALFLAVGVPLFWITVPRLAMAILAVWIEKSRRHYFRRSFRAGVD
jgi:hypothetical protein